MLYFRSFLIQKPTRFHVKRLGGRNVYQVGLEWNKLERVQIGIAHDKPQPNRFALKWPDIATVFPSHGVPDRIGIHLRTIVQSITLDGCAIGFLDLNTNAGSAGGLEIHRQIAALEDKRSGELITDSDFSREALASDSFSDCNHLHLERPHRILCSGADGDARGELHLRTNQGFSHNLSLHFSSAIKGVSAPSTAPGP